MKNESYKDEWDLCGDVDPYYGVLSAERFRGRTLTTEAREEFFRTGEEHVAKILEKIKLHVDQSFSPCRILDFGCGVGRLLIPFARVSNEVTGIDISEGMLTEAKSNCEMSGLNNVSFLNSVQEVSGVFDLVHSYIVFQHMPPAIGVNLLETLLAKVAPNGVIALHFTYYNEGSRLRKLISRLRRKSRFLHRSLNLLQGRPFREPLLQMNEYSLSSVMAVLQTNQFRGLHLYFTHHANSFGLVVIGSKSGSDYEF